MYLSQSLRIVLRPFAFALSGLLLAPAAPALAAEASLTAPGADEELEGKLQAASAALTSLSRGETGVQELLAAALSDYKTLVQVLYDAGRFSPVVNIRLDGREAATISPLSPPSSIDRIEITVQPGPQFTFGRAEVTPWPPESDVEIPEAYATGKPAGTGAIQDAGDAGIKAWRREGHPKVALGGQDITADHQAARLDSRLQMTPGPKLRFGNFAVTGDTKVREESIRAIAGFPTGETFHPDLLAKSATRLRRTGAFSAVTIKEADQPNPDGTLDYTLEFEDLPLRRLTFGAELSSSDGLEITGTWMHRNLFGGAEKLRFEARLSGIGADSTSDLDGRIALRLDRPDTLGPDDNTFYLLEAERLNEEHYTATRGLGMIGVRRVFSDRFFAEGGIGFESVLSEDVFGKRRFKYAIGAIRTEYDGRDNRVSATSGYFVNAQALPFIGIDGSESGLQLKVDGRTYFGFGANDSVVLAGRMQIGSVIGPALSEVSPTRLFFSGGAGSVRGQPYESLGVPVAGGVAGGRGYLALAGEVRGKITDKISLVGFYDVGFVDADSFVSNSSERHSGAGLGLRYDVAGIGPIRLDLAYPVDGGTGDGLQFYIGIGQAF